MKQKNLEIGIFKALFHNVPHKGIKFTNSVKYSSKLIKKSIIFFTELYSIFFKSELKQVFIFFVKTKFKFNSYVKYCK